MARPNQITLCSFCGKSHSEVRKLIAGPGVYICDNCILVCKNVLDKELQTEEKKKSIKLNVPKPKQIKAGLDEHCIGQDEAKKALGRRSTQPLQAHPVRPHRQYQGRQQDYHH